MLRERVLGKDMVDIDVTNATGEMSGSSKIENNTLCMSFPGERVPECNEV